MKNSLPRILSLQMVCTQFKKKTFVFLAAILLWNIGLNSQPIAQSSLYMASVDIASISMESWLHLRPSEVKPGINANEVSFVTCAITGITVSNLSACDDNNTSNNPADDTFTADVSVTFLDPPGSGNLVLSGDGSASVAVAGINSPHVFNGVQMPADGGPISLTATFDMAAPLCTFTNSNAGTAPPSCSPPPCDIMITNVTPVAPVCPSNNNGKITVTATGTGTIEYSIDGNNFQTSNEFINLTTGNYTVTARIQGSNPVCSASQQTTVPAPTGGGLTYNGNVYFTSQAQVDAWSSCYSKINGVLTILGFNITNLGPLSNITEVTGTVTIQSTGLVNMNGMNNLTTIGGYLFMYYNFSMTSLSGLNALNSVGGGLQIYYNLALSNCCAIYSLINGANPPSPIVIFFNKAGCNSVAEINSNCVPPILAPPSTTELYTSEQLGKDKKINLFPNPANQNVAIRISEEFESGSVRIFDWTGRYIFTQVLQIGNLEQVIDLREWVTGVYLVQVKLDGKKMTKKLVVN